MPPSLPITAGSARATVAALLSALALAGCAAEADEAVSAPLPVVIATVTPLGGLGEIAAVGRVAYEREAVLSFRTAGVLRAVTVNVGDRVARGALIAAIDGADSRARLEEADAVLSRQAQTMARYDALAESGAVARALVEDQRATVAEARSARAAAAYDQQSSRLTAPAAGIVLERIAQVGETVSPGQAVARVADVGSRLIVRAPLAAADAIRIRLGAAATIELPGGAELGGRVLRVGGQADVRTGTIDVEIALDPSVRSLVASGMTARVRIGAPTSATPGQVRAPAEAVLVERGGAAFVFIVDAKGTAHRRPVTLVRYADDDAVVTGLEPGAAVITAGAGFVVNGQTVAVTRRAAR